MGKFGTTGIEEAATVCQDLPAAFTATGAGTSVAVNGPFNAFLWGAFVATVELQRSFDGGTTWLACSVDSIGTPADYAAPVSLIVAENEPAMLYRWYCTAYTSGTAHHRISSGPRLT